MNIEIAYKAMMKESMYITLIPQHYCKLNFLST